MSGVGKNLKMQDLDGLSQLEADKFKIYQDNAENLPHCRTMEELEKCLLKLGIETQYKYKGQTQERQGVSFKIGNICFKGSQVDRKFSLAGLEKTIATLQKQSQEQRQAFLQKVKQRERPAGQIQRLIKQSSPSNTSKGLDPTIADGLAKGMGNVIQMLLKAEENFDQVPYELTQDYLKRK